MVRVGGQGEEEEEEEEEEAFGGLSTPQVGLHTRIRRGLSARDRTPAV